MTGKFFHNEKPLLVKGDEHNSNYRNEHLDKLNLNEFPLIADFEIRTKETELSGYVPVYFCSSEHGILSFLAYDILEKKLMEKDFLKNEQWPLWPPLKTPYQGIEQGCQLIIWERNEFIYVMRSYYECSGKFEVWFKVDKEKYADEWKKIASKYQAIFTERCI